MRRLTLATAERKDSRTWAQREVTWTEFVERTAEPADRKECGQYVFGALNDNRRNRYSIIHRDAVTLDADAAGPRLPEQVAALGYAALVHSTYSSSEDQPRYRVVIPTDRPVTPDEYRALAAQLIAELGADQFDPGSTQPERYMFWPAAREPESYERHVYDGPLLAVDLELAETCREATEKERTESAGGLVTAQHRSKAEAVLSKATRDIADRGEGSRNATVYAALVPLVSFVKAGAIAEDAVRAGLWDAVAAVPASEPYTRAEFEASWQSAWAVADARLPAVDTPADDFTVWAEPDAVELRFPALSLAALLNPNRPERQWVVDNFIPAGTAVSLVAKAGSKKSLIALRLALAVARGERDFAGMAIPERRRVFYLDTENTEDDLRERLLSFGVTAEDEPTLRDWLRLVSFPQMEPLDTASGGALLLAALDAYGLQPGDLVVLDSFQRVTTEDENDAGTARAYYRYTGLALKQRGLTVVRLDNTGKDEDRGARGSSAKLDDVDIEYRLRATRDDVRITTGKARLRAIDPDGLVVRVAQSDGLTTFTSDVPPTEQDKVTECVEALDAAGLPWDIGQDAAWQWVQDENPGYFKRAAHVRPAVTYRKQRGGDFRAE